MANNKSRCPVCGRFTNEAAIAKYNEDRECLMQETRKWRARNDMKKEEIKTLQQSYYTLQQKYDAKAEECERLKRRSVWKVLFGRKG